MKYDEFTFDGMRYDLNFSYYASLCCRSGCGKSTLLGIAAGLYQPSQGHVTLLGEREKGNKDDTDSNTVLHADGDILRAQVGDSFFNFNFNFNSYLRPLFVGIHLSSSRYCLALYIVRFETLIDGTTALTI